MEITKILQTIKGKVLDATHFELLRNAYELQEKNITQLKSNNEALKESNVLIKEHMAELKRRIEGVESECEQLRARTPSLKGPEDDYEPSELAREILMLYKRSDDTHVFDGEIASYGQHSLLAVQAAFDELKRAEIVGDAGIFGDRGAGYALTEGGRRYALGFGESS